MNDYDKDLYKWAYEQAEYIKNGDFGGLDKINVIEELECLARSEKRTLARFLELVLKYKLMLSQLPEGNPVFEYSLRISTRNAHSVLADNPSLKVKLKEILKESYFLARLQALIAIGKNEFDFPEECPWTLNEIFPDQEEKH